MIFSFNFLGRNSYSDFGLCCDKTPSNPLPQRNITFSEVSERDGSICEDDETYKDITISISCWLVDNNNLPDKIDEIKAWLAGGEGDLILNTQPNKKYIARVIEQIDITQEYRALGKFQIIFRCQPFKYLVSNDPIEITTTPYNLLNNGWNCEPIIKVYGTGNITLTINDTIIILTGITDYIILDSVIEHAYKYDENNNEDNCNSLMKGEFPKFKNGNNTISFTGGVTKLEVTPNFRFI